MRYKRCVDENNVLMAIKEYYAGNKTGCEIALKYNMTESAFWKHKRLYEAKKKYNITNECETTNVSDSTNMETTRIIKEPSTRKTKNKNYDYDPCGLQASMIPINETRHGSKENANEHRNDNTYKSSTIPIEKPVFEQKKSGSKIIKKYDENEFIDPMTGRLRK